MTTAQIGHTFAHNIDSWGDTVKRGGRVVAAVLLVLGILAPTPAGANNDLGIRVPNGRDVGLYYSTLDTAFEQAATWVRANRINPTNVQTILKSSSAADIRLGLANYSWPSNRWGEYQCMAADYVFGVLVCFDGRIRFHSNRNWTVEEDVPLIVELGVGLQGDHTGGV